MKRKKEERKATVAETVLLNVSAQKPLDTRVTVSVKKEADEALENERRGWGVSE